MGLVAFNSQVLAQEAQTTDAAEDATSTEASNEDCAMPASPIIPDGNVASEDELVAASKAMKAFQGNLVEYRNCLAAKDAALDPEAEDTAAKKTALNNSYNVSVDAEGAVADEFNAAVRAFKARQ